MPVHATGGRRKAALRFGSQSSRGTCNATAVFLARFVQWGGRCCGFGNALFRNSGRKGRSDGLSALCAIEQNEPKAAGFGVAQVIICWELKAQGGWLFAEPDFEHGAGNRGGCRSSSTPRVLSKGADWATSLSSVQLISRCSLCPPWQSAAAGANF